MTIEEIKEWRIGFNRKNKILHHSTGMAIIDTLLAEVERLNDCKGCDAPRQLAVAAEALERIVEALERIADLPHLSAPLSYNIARTALERMRG